MISHVSKFLEGVISELEVEKNYEGREKLVRKLASSTSKGKRSLHFPQNKSKDGVCTKICE
jgi:hypothetical protein